jgi:23S rRNA (guanosine2251-2'-O)-methyltransferase
MIRRTKSRVMGRKRTIEDHRRKSARRQRSPRPHLYLILDNIRSLNNVGAIFRAADGCGVRKIFLCGITPSPPRPEIAKISLGAEDNVEYESLADPTKALRLLQAEGVTVLCAEQTTASQSIYETAFPHPLAIVLGHETDGVDVKVLELADGEVEIPMFGGKHSHNVATATGIILSEVRRRWQVDPQLLGETPTA